MLVSEQLAEERSIELASMNQVIQLVIQHIQEVVLVIDKNGNIQQHNMRVKKLPSLYGSINKPKLLKLSDYYVSKIANKLSSRQERVMLNLIY